MKYVLKLILICTFASPVLAQENGLQLIDEFGRLNDEERLARTDNLAFSLKNNPDKIAIVHLSGGRDRSPSFNYLYGALIKAQLINHSKIDPARIEIQNCSVDKAYLETSFYIAAGNAARPVCDPSLPAFEKTAIFGTFYHGNGDEIPGCCEVLGGNKAVQDIFESKILEFLVKVPAARVTLVGYSGTNTSEPENARAGPRIVTHKGHRWDNPVIVTNVIKKIAARFRENGIDPNRINVTKGGYRYEGGHVEFWIVPVGGEIPKARSDFLVKKPAKRSGKR